MKTAHHFFITICVVSGSDEMEAIMEKSLPNEKEIEVLTLFYNKFYDLYEEITNDNFLREDAQLRFFKLRESFSIYKELLSYEPIKNYIEWMKKGGI